MITLKKVIFYSAALALLLYGAYNISQYPECECNLRVPVCVEVERIAGDQISYYQNPLDSEAMRDYYEHLKRQCCSANPRHSCCERNLDAQVVQNESHSEVS